MDYQMAPRNEKFLITSSSAAPTSDVCVYVSPLFSFSKPQKQSKLRLSPKPKPQLICSKSFTAKKATSMSRFEAECHQSVRNHYLFPTACIVLTAVAFVAQVINFLLPIALSNEKLGKHQDSLPCKSNSIDSHRSLFILLA
jgi:hypothetical protein